MLEANDMTLCGNGAGCPRGRKCYRCMAIPDVIDQSYSDFYVKGKKCDSFVRLMKGDKLKKPVVKMTSLDVKNMLVAISIDYENLQKALVRAKYTDTFYEMDRDCNTGMRWCGIFRKWIEDAEARRE